LESLAIDQVMTTVRSLFGSSLNPRVDKPVQFEGKRISASEFCPQFPQFNTRLLSVLDSTRPMFTLNWSHWKLGHCHKTPQWWRKQT